MMLFKCLLILFFCLAGMFSLSRVFELGHKVYKRRHDRTQIARLKSSNDLFMLGTWFIASFVCAFVFTVMAII